MGPSVEMAFVHLKDAISPNFHAHVLHERFYCAKECYNNNDYQFFGSGISLFLKGCIDARFI